MTQRTYDLKLADGKIVQWSGKDPTDAVTRYVDAHREAAVVAVREGNRHGLFVLGSADQIVG